jgi:ABC-type multidrug transport system ATPase subunit
VKIVCENLGKRFQYNWIIRNCNWHFDEGSLTGIAGGNGTGKSTMIKLLSTHLSPSQGKIYYLSDGEKLDHSEIYPSLSLVGPYTSLIQEYNINEQFKFHFKFKTPLFDFSFDEFLQILAFPGYKDKAIENYSSGMHQRLQLALAILSKTELLLLDEPTSFLDFDARKWFYLLLQKYRGSRTIIIASNDQDDLQVCDSINDIRELKAIV